MSRVLKNRENHITQKYGKNHCGVDIISTTGSGIPDIVAHSQGIVVVSVNNKDRDNTSTGANSYGNYVQIKHPNNMYTLYAHLKKGSVKVKKGDNVSLGQVIGTMGNSGRTSGTSATTGIHLHFEVRNKDNYVIDPTPYIDEDLPNLPTNLPEPVERDENTYQVEVLIKDLRARAGFGLDKAILGFTKKGIYNIYNKATKDNLVWLKICEDIDIWVAYSEEWAKLYEIKDYKELYENELLTNKDLQAQINLLKIQVDELQDKINKAKKILG